MNQADARRSPPWWDHQRHVLRALRVALDRTLETRVPFGPRPLRILDLGAGAAPYRPLFETRGADYVTCDLDGAADVRLVAGEPVPLPDGSVDGVVSFQVLEHVWDVEGYLREAYRLLKPGGFLLLSTHGTWPYHPHPTDFRRWTRDGLEGELTAAGLRIEETQGLVGPLAWTTQIRLLGLREGLSPLGLAGSVLTAALAVIMNARMVLEDAITPASVRATNACVYLTFATRA